VGGGVGASANVGAREMASRRDVSRRVGEAARERRDVSRRVGEAARERRDGERVGETAVGDTGETSVQGGQ
jgi:hypothetical protein